MESLLVQEQLLLVQNADVIEGSHDAGLAWVLATRRSKRLLFEVAPSLLVHNNFRAVATIPGLGCARTGELQVGMEEPESVTLDDFNFSCAEEVVKQIDEVLECRGTWNEKN
jgi:hypothetical protein